MEWVIQNDSWLQILFKTGENFEVLFIHCLIISEWIHAVWKMKMLIIPYLKEMCWLKFNKTNLNLRMVRIIEDEIYLNGFILSSRFFFYVCANISIPNAATYSLT